MNKALSSFQSCYSAVCLNDLGSVRGRHTQWLGYKQAVSMPSNTEFNPLQFKKTPQLVLLVELPLTLCLKE